MAGVAQDMFFFCSGNAPWDLVKCRPCLSLSVSGFEFEWKKGNGEAEKKTEPVGLNLSGLLFFRIFLLLNLFRK